MTGTWLLGNWAAAFGSDWSKTAAGGIYNGSLLWSCVHVSTLQEMCSELELECSVYEVYSTHVGV